MKPPKLPAKDVIAQIQRQIGRLDRSVFTETLATAVACAPSATSWRKLSKKDPESWSRAVVNMSKLTGFAERKETVTFTPKMADVATELVARFGEEQARMLLKAAGAPENILPAPPINSD